MQRLLAAILALLLTCSGAAPFGLSLAAPTDRLNAVGINRPYGLSTDNATWYSQTWAATMSSTSKSQLLAAGIRDIRLYVDPAAFSVSSDATILTQLTSGPFVAITDLLASGFHKVIFDFHWQPSPSVTAGWGASDVIAITSTADVKFARMVHIATVIAPLLVSNYGDNVIFELFNEPPSSGAFTGVTWDAQLLFYYNAVRAVAPTLKLIVTCMNQGDTGTFLSFNLAPFASDPNVYFSIHDYQPSAFTPQDGIGGNGAGAFWAQYVNRLEFPPGTGGQTRLGTEAAAATLVNADTSTSSGQKTGFISTINTLIDAYFNTPQDAAWLQARFASAAAHTDAAGVARYRLFEGEHGCVGDPSADNARSYTSPTGGGLGASQASRVTYYSTVSQEARILGTSLSTHSFAQDPYEITDGSSNVIQALAAGMYP